jgi:hypothetical protein
MVKVEVLDIAVLLRHRDKDGKPGEHVTHFVRSYWMLKYCEYLGNWGSSGLQSTLSKILHTLLLLLRFAIDYFGGMV